MRSASGSGWRVVGPRAASLRRWCLLRRVPARRASTRRPLRLGRGARRATPTTSRRGRCSRRRGEPLGDRPRPTSRRSAPIASGSTPRCSTRRRASAPPKTRTADIEKRLDLLNGSADAIRQSLQARRGSIAEILAVLQRMGLHPLPALLASPDDVLRAIRTSMLLGAVVPEMRSAAEALASDLAELTRPALRHRRAARRARQRGRVARRPSARASPNWWRPARPRRRRPRARSTGRAGAPPISPARRPSLKDLVARLETDVASARRAAEAARAADEARRRAAEADAAGVEAKAAARPRGILPGSRPPWPSATARAN